MDQFAFCRWTSLAPGNSVSINTQQFSGTLSGRWIFYTFTHPASRKYLRHSARSSRSHQTATAQISSACNEARDGTRCLFHLPVELLDGGLRITGAISVLAMLSNHESLCLRASWMFKVCTASESTRGGLGKKNPPQALNRVAAYKPSQPLLRNASTSLKNAVPDASMHLHFSFCSL